MSDFRNVDYNKATIAVCFLVHTALGLLQPALVDHWKSTDHNLKIVSMLYHFTDQQIKEKCLKPIDKDENWKFEMCYKTSL